MSISLQELFAELIDAGLSLRRCDRGSVEIVGDLKRVTDNMRDAVGGNLPALVACLPPPPLSPEEQATADSDNIREQLNEFGDWLFTAAPWAAVERSRAEDIDKRLAVAVDTNDPEQVAETIAGLKSDLEVINWATEILPRSYEIEAKHAVAAGAAATDEPLPEDGIPF